MTSLNLDYFLKSSNTVPLGLKASTYEFEENAIQSITWLKMAALAHTFISTFQLEDGEKKRGHNASI